MIFSNVKVNKLSSKMLRKSPRQPFWPKNEVVKSSVTEFFQKYFKKAFSLYAIFKECISLK